MGRPLRIEYPGALYHVISRGNERKSIFRDDSDRGRFLGVLGACPTITFYKKQTPKNLSQIVEQASFWKVKGNLSEKTRLF
ncbi:MAG: hypothetical protein U9P80_07755, partial [Thermodesulfobacteriota bacterium]|nr:hypothetical protein [Thermodesulfobacteriota bacterium]